jgi:hypothetical protein
VDKKQLLMTKGRMWYKWMLCSARFGAHQRRGYIELSRTREPGCEVLSLEGKPLVLQGLELAWEIWAALPGLVHNVSIAEGIPELRGVVSHRISQCYVPIASRSRCPRVQVDIIGIRPGTRSGSYHRPYIPSGSFRVRPSRPVRPVSTRAQTGIKKTFMAALTCDSSPPVFFPSQLSTDNLFFSSWLFELLCKDPRCFLSCRPF